MLHENIYWKLFFVGNVYWNLYYWKEEKSEKHYTIKPKEISWFWFLFLTHYFQRLCKLPLFFTSVNISNYFSCNLFAFSHSVTLYTKNVFSQLKKNCFIFLNVLTINLDDRKFKYIIGQIILLLDVLNEDTIRILPYLLQCIYTIIILHSENCGFMIYYLLGYHKSACNYVTLCMAFLSFCLLLERETFNWTILSKFL